MNQSPLLFQLQQVDDEISQVEVRLKEIEVAIASDKETIQAMEHLTNTKNDAFLSTHALREAEAVVKEIRIKIATSEQSLYGGKIRNPKELQDLQIEIASLKKRLSNAEDKELEQMIGLEEAEKALEIAESNLQEVKNKKATQLSLLHGEQDTLNKKLERLQKERHVTIGSVSNENLQIYNNLRTVKNGKAVAQIGDNACAVCGANIRPSEKQATRSSSRLVYCDTCGRILYSD